MNYLEGEEREGVSVACHDPDFDPAKESHQMALTLRIDSNDLILGKDHKYNT